jgi:superfamily II DNA or RNA helicase
MYELRDYQKEIEVKVLDLWQNDVRCIMVQLATGGGKTPTFGTISAPFLKNGLRVLVIAHREELLLQAQEKMEAISGLSAGIIKNGYKPNPLYNLQIASIQSLARRQNLPPADLVIVDEAHHACSQSYTKVLERYPDTKILGFTATPCRNDGQGFKYLFKSLICGPSTKELIDRGYLSSYKLYQAGKTINTNKIKSSGGDFNTEKLSEAVAEQIEPNDVVAEWKRRAGGKRTVVFAVDVARSCEYAEAFQAAGIPAEHLDGETETGDRRDVLQRFESGKTIVLCNCGIISEGFDLPGIEVVQIVRPTKSLSLWLQMVGRGLRLADGKNFATIIDHGKSWESLGLPDEEREWSLEPQSLGIEAKRFLHVVCESCSHIFKPLSHEIPDLKCICPNCLTENTFKVGSGGGEKPKPALNANDKDKEIDLTPNPTHTAIIDDLLTNCQRLKYPIAWVYHQFTEISKEWRAEISLGTWRYLAKKLGHSTMWARLKYQEANEENKPLSTIELHRLWSKALSEVRPYGTQALLRQHGHLVQFTNNTAEIRITSLPLLNMVKDRICNIEIAFRKVLQREISAKLGVKNH